MILRLYQEETITALRNHVSLGNRRALVAWPTGTGKTVLAASICRTAHRPVLIVAHRYELLEQAAAKIRAFVPDADIGMIRRDTNDWQRQYVVASVQTLAQPGRLAQIPRNYFGVVFIDEAHHAAAATYRRVIEHFDALIIGLSATPYRLDGEGLDDIFGDKPVYVYEIQQAVKDRYLVPPRAWVIQLEADLDRVHTVAGDFNVGELVGEMNTHRNAAIIIDAWRTHAADRRTILFAVNVEHATNLAESFRTAGIASECVDGGMSDDDRATAFERFKSGQTRVLTNCQIATEGYDDAGIGAIIMARPTKSRALFTQCVGRGLRPAEGKLDCILLDCVGATRRHKLVGVHHLFGIDKENLDGQTPEEIEAEQQENGNRRVADLFFNGSTRWTALPVSLFIKDTLTTFTPSKEWHFNPASEKQIALLRKFGLDFGDDPPICGAASVLIDALIAERDAEPATEKQQRYLRHHGQDPHGLTKREAGRLIQEIREGAEEVTA